MAKQNEAFKGSISLKEETLNPNNLKRMVTLTDEAFTYIENYQRICKKVLREAQKKGKIMCMLQSQWINQKPCGD